jgi:hypothetical protein
MSNYEIGDTVRAEMQDRWSRYDTMLRTHLERNFPGASSSHDDIVSDVMIKAYEDSPNIETKYNRLITLNAFIWGWMRKNASWRAISALQKLAKKQELAGHSDRDEEQDELARLPTPIIGAEQEEILFLKQVIEGFGMLPEEELAHMWTITDRTDLSEMCAQVRELKNILKEMRSGDTSGFMSLRNRLTG